MAKNNLSVQHATSYDIMTTLEAFTYKPQIWPDLRKSFGMGILDFDIINTLKKSTKFIASESYTVQEELPPWRLLKMRSDSAVGTVPGGVAYIVLDNDDLDTMGNYYPRIHQEITLGNAYHKAVVTITDIVVTATTPNTVTLTVYPKAGSTATTPITLDSSYIYTGAIGAYMPAVTTGNETDAVKGTMSGYQEFTFYLETMKSNKTFGDSRFATETWRTPQGKGLWNKAVADLDMELDAAMEMKIHVGEENINTTYIYDTSLATSASVPIFGTKGIWNWIGERGKDITYTNASGFPIENFYQAAEYGETVGLPNGDWMFNSGGNLLRTVEKSCKSYITNATGSLNEMFTPEAGGGMKNLEVGFKSIMIGQQRFYLKTNHLFTNPYFLGGLPGFKDAAELFPLMDVRDKKSGSWVPNLHIVYRGVEGYDRARIIAPFAGMGGALKQMVGAPIVLEGDISKLHALSEWGLAAMEMWRGMRIYNTDLTT
jgi:hypothetical protein